MSKETKTLIGIAGVLCLILGIFAPFVSMPFLGAISILKFNGYVGAILFACAGVGGYFALKAAFKYMMYVGIAGLATTALTAVWFEYNLSRMRSQVDTELAGNPFAGIAGAMTQSVQLDWGVAILAIGAALLVVPAVVKSPDDNQSTSKPIDPRLIRYGAIAAAVLVISIIAFNVLGSLMIGGTTITPSNQAQVAEKVSSSNMSDGDKAEFSAAMSRTDYDSTGKTVTQAISDQRAFEAEQKAAAQRAAELAAEEKAKRDATLRAMLNALTVAVTNKSFLAADPMNSGTYEDQITVSFAFRNTSSKDIRGFKGDFIWTSLMADQIKDTALEYDQTIPAGHIATWEGQITYNQFEGSDVKLKDADLKDLRTRWEPQSILFADGSKLVLSEADAMGSSATTP